MKKIITLTLALILTLTSIYTMPIKADSTMNKATKTHITFIKKNLHSRHYNSETEKNNNKNSIQSLLYHKSNLKKKAFYIAIISYLTFNTIQIDYDYSKILNNIFKKNIKKNKAKGKIKNIKKNNYEITYSYSYFRNKKINKKYGKYYQIQVLTMGINKKTNVIFGTGFEKIVKCSKKKAKKKLKSFKNKQVKFTKLMLNK